MFIHPFKSIHFKNYWIALCLFFVVLAIFIYKNRDISSDYYVIEPIAVHENGKAFIGSNSCVPCHTDIYDVHVKTAHFRTSAVADSSNIKGSFELGRNTHILNDRVQFTMVATDSGFYQRANFIHNQLELFNLRMDIVIGSGTKGQSYLSWENNELFQLQTSYFTPNKNWTSSPGLKGIASPRPVVARCFECHSTFAKSTTSDKKGNGYDKSQIIYGIDCERCHGPSAKHVGYHQKNPDAKVSKYMIKHSALSQQQRLDACALCHSGGRKSIKPPFSFLVGDDLDQFSTSKPKQDNVPLDVHGNQYELLTNSMCFKKSQKMNCTTCHNPHKNERGKVNVFNLKCISCHTQPKTTCTEREITKTMESNNCISCHMPLVSSKSMRIQLDTIETAVKVRTHLIAVYPKEETKKSL
ncbi:MAG: cytochrome c3 family protein [Bacteroidota bacterium]